jgi:hypothetical protein
MGGQLFGIAGALLGVPVAATAMALLEIYKRRYELTAGTEEQVAALVAPSVERAWGDSEGADDDDPDAVPAVPLPAAARAGTRAHETKGDPAAPGAQPPQDDQHDGKEPA